MLPGSAAADLASRLGNAEKRVGRLETLEFGTVAFPSGGFTSICDIIVGPAPAASVTLCPLGIPSTFKHLFVVCHYFSTDPRIPFFIGNMEMNFNGDFGAVYLSHQRQELSFGPPFTLDGETVPIGAGADTKFSLPRPAQFNTTGTPQTPTMCFVLIPAYSRVGNFKSFAHWGAGNPTTGSSGFSGKDGDQGGGEYRRFAGGIPPAPITSITFSHMPPGTFAPGSHFTLYGMP